ncbi:hypothetical protein [Collimonas sp.]|jgi:hypothetical protein|uniref:hypothetical protein n=1 Tax=Collimonas sp. TaxID=1963772 RepID=UPI002B891C63|nr:hypothetical protein [Collimonas sp.]HWW06858.1 hypothetical protein [Collimonas sp.]
MDSNQSQHAKLSSLGRALRDLHKQLIHVETQNFGVVGSPLEHLHLVVNHPHFSWLQKLSGLMAQMDERLDEPEEISAADAYAFRVAIEELIGPGEKGDMAFRAKYNALLHDSPDLVMAHGALRQILVSVSPQNQPAR